MSESNSADVFSADKFIQLAPNYSHGFGQVFGAYLLEDLDGNGFGDRGIDLDKDGDVDLAIWSFPSQMIQPIPLDLMNIHRKWIAMRENLFPGLNHSV